MATKNTALEYLLNEIKEQQFIINNSNDSCDIFFARQKIIIANNLIQKYKLKQAD